MELSPDSNQDPQNSANPGESTPPTSEDPETEAGWTPLKFLLALILAILLGVSGTGFFLSWRGDLGNSSVKKNPLVAQLMGPEALNLGPTIEVQFEIVNQGTNPVPVADHTGRSERQEQYDVVVRPVDAKDPLPTLGPTEQETKSLEPHPVILLPPGKKISWSLNIADYVAIEKPGRYEVTISRHPFIDEVRVEAPSIIIQLN